MKKIFISIIAILGIFGTTSCSDMLETDSTSLLIDPDLNHKTDSLFYAYGIFSAMQMAADQYVMQGEARGDLLDVTKATSSDLRQLASYQATAANKYDSAYVYYRIINNCNYYLAKRDTTLTTGGQNVVINEYAGVAAIRAWAYLQLVRNYKEVPLVTKPLTMISEINSTNFPKVDITGLVAALSPSLEKFTGMYVPTGSGDVNVGGKNVYSNRCFIPVDVVLGEMYMEAGEYTKAAQHFSTYLITNKITSLKYEEPISARLRFYDENGFMVPNDWHQRENDISTSTWKSTLNSKSELVSYIPMAVNSLRGITSELPLIFGYNYYNISGLSRYNDQVQLKPSKALFAVADSCDYYYYSTRFSDIPEESKNYMRTGDNRIYSFMSRGHLASDTSLVWAGRYDNADIVLYRNSGIFLRLAECFNRMGYPDAAFAVLKEGICDLLLKDFAVSEDKQDALYITPATREMLQTICPFLSEANIATYAYAKCYGIHRHGCGVTEDRTYPGSSPYQYKTVVGKKMADIAKAMNVAVGTTKQDTINAVEDLICDEYALELTFDGNRYYDLLRMARAKNKDTLYGAGFGTTWLLHKLAAKPGSDILSDENNWYLPFK